MAVRVADSFSERNPSLPNDATRGLAAPDLTGPGESAGDDPYAGSQDSLIGLAGETWKPYLQRPGTPRAYLLALGGMVAVLTLDAAVNSITPIPPLAALFPVTLIIGLFCGARATALAMAVGLAAVSLCGPPVGFTHDVSHNGRLLRGTFFVFLGGLVIWITATLRRALYEAESARLKVDAALGQGNVGAWEVALETQMVRASTSAHRMFGLRYTGRALPIDAWLGRVHPRDVEAVRSRIGLARREKTGFAAEFRVLRDDGDCIWVMARGGIVNVGGAPHLMGALVNVTDRHVAEERFQDTSALLRTIVETAPVMIYAKDLQGRMLLANPPVLKLVGKSWQDLEGHTDSEFLADAAQAAAVMENDRRLMDEDQAEHVEELVGEDDGMARVWSSAKAPLHDSTGKVAGLVGVSIEITDRKRIENRLRLMVDELNHRVKNTLAVAQAVAVRTLQGTDPGTRQVLVERLTALAAAHDLLTRERWEGVELADVIAVVLAPYHGTDDPRVQVGGPKLRLSPKAAQAFSMGFHELATNALKYGAMSNQNGSVSVQWRILEGAEPRLCVTWREAGGPQVVPPARTGFGSWLMQRGLPHDLGGTVMLDFGNADGVVCTIEAPVREVAATKMAIFPSVGAAARA